MDTLPDVYRLKWDDCYPRNRDGHLGGHSDETKMASTGPLKVGHLGHLGGQKMTTVANLGFPVTCRAGVSPSAAWAAARRAIGTRNGEQLT